MFVTARIRATIVVEVETGTGMIALPRVVIPVGADWQIAEGLEPEQAARVRGVLHGSDERWFYDADLQRAQSSPAASNGVTGGEHQQAHRSRSGWLFSDAPDAHAPATDTASADVRHEESSCDFCD